MGDKYLSVPAGTLYWLIDQVNTASLEHQQLLGMLNVYSNELDLERKRSAALQARLDMSEQTVIDLRIEARKWAEKCREMGGAS